MGSPARPRSKRSVGADTRVSGHTRLRAVDRHCRRGGHCCRGAVMAIAALRGMGKAKPGGWSAAEAMIGHKVCTKDREAADE